LKDRRKAREEYSGLGQKPHESIKEFKTKFDAFLDTYRACGQDIPADDDLAADFMKK